MMIHRYKEENMRINKTILIIGGILLVTIIACLVFSYLTYDVGRSASRYGISDKTKSALVIENNTSEFYILGVSISGDQSQAWATIIPMGEEQVFSINPGSYQLKIRYSNHADLENLGFLTWYVDAQKSIDFGIRKGLAAIFSLEGGDVSGMMYDPPDLISK